MPTLQRRDVWPEVVDLIGVDFFGHATNVHLGENETDALLVQVGRLSRLQRLNVNQPPPQSLVYGHGRPSRLQRLNGSTSSVCDAGLAHLKGLSGLSILYLNGNRVSDAGIAHLKGLANLSTLPLPRTQVTDAGVKELRRALPNLLRIIH
jgi:Leucine-rich repeat (LRR) protein